MAETFKHRPRRYILDARDEDLQRLVGISELYAETARRAFDRVGVGAGWTAIDCGCGPIGGVAVLADMVGPTGRVVGVDFSEPTIDRARSVVAALGLDNVELIVGDIHDLDVATLGGPFDVAFTRLFLMHQPDPVRTLGRIAALLRPGGWIVAHEALRNPPPRSQPQLDALGVYWDLVHDVLEIAGVPRGTVDGLPQFARAAGLEVVETGGFFVLTEPEIGFDLHASTIAAAKERAVNAGIAARRIDELVAELRAGRAGGYDWVTSPFHLDLALRKPDAV